MKKILVLFALLMTGVMGIHAQEGLKWGAMAGMNSSKFSTDGFDSKVVVSAGKLSSEAAFDSVIRHYSKQVYNNLQAPAVALLQEEYYSQLRKIVSVKDKSSFERKSWDENGLFDYRSYSDLFKCHYEKHAVKVEQRG